MNDETPTPSQQIDLKKEVSEIARRLPNYVKLAWLVSNVNVQSPAPAKVEAPV